MPTSPGAGSLVSPPDFVVPPVDDLRDCPWWRPVRIAVAPDETADPLMTRFLPRLVDAFSSQGHEVSATPCGAADMLLVTASVPQRSGWLADRIEERRAPLAATAHRDHGMPGRPPHIVPLVGVGERMADLDHLSAVELGRVAMARIGTSKVLFVSGDRAQGRVAETTLCTLEGGHPTDMGDRPDRVRDRLVAAACAREVGGAYDVVPGGLHVGAWRRTTVPDAIVEAGRRMDALGLLPPPRRVDEYVSPRMAALYQRLLGLSGFSEGTLFAFDPDTETVMVTASGSWDVDKRALRRDEVVPVDFRGDGRRLRVLAQDAGTAIRPSVEAAEIIALLRSVPTVRLGRDDTGTWVPRSDGPVEAPVVRAGIHTHLGIEAVDPARVESLPANRRLFPFGFGCGTDLMHHVVRDVAARSEAMRDLADPRAFVRWPTLYHGDTLVELWRPSSPRRPLEVLLDLFEDGGIVCTPDHVDQPA